MFAREAGDLGFEAVPADNSPRRFNSYVCHPIGDVATDFPGGMCRPFLIVGKSLNRARSGGANRDVRMPNPCLARDRPVDDHDVGLRETLGSHSLPDRSGIRAPPRNP